MTERVAPTGTAGRSRTGGFTLVEIMVALAIVAVALTAGMRTVRQATDGAAALKARTLALWVAQNRLAAAQLAPPDTALANLAGEEQQAGLRFLWRVNAGATPNPAFRRIEIVVAAPDAPDYALATLIGYIGNPVTR
jgi:general secretion pathway protein I